jgi:hypothetical protein
VLYLPLMEVYDPEVFLQDEYPTWSGDVGFSRNVVRLEVSGSNLVDVTFIDLPGIIANANQVLPLLSSVTSRNG